MSSSSNKRRRGTIPKTVATLCAFATSQAKLTPRGLQLAPRNSTMIDAHKEAKFLAACQERDQLAMRRSQKSGVGEEDIIGILRGRLKDQCPAYSMSEAMERSRTLN